MQVAYSLAELSAFAGPSVVTIGNFDGVHCGHRMVIAAVRERARALSVEAAQPARAVAITFDPHPAHLLRPTPRLPLITPLAQRLELLAGTGLDLVLVLPFDEALRRWTAERFAREVLREALNTVEVHEGETFRFGHQAEADVASLASLGERFGFTVRAYEPLIVRKAAVSSSRIRSLLAAGALAPARVLLGRSFAVTSTPAAGRGYGSRYAVPTINLAPYADLLPAHGVYVTTLAIGEGPTARLFRGVTNIGNRPTFGADSFAVETYLFAFEPVDLTPTTPLRMTFLHRLRAERRFDSPDLLRAQIGRDVAHAERFFALADTLHADLG